MLHKFDWERFYKDLKKATIEHGLKRTYYLADIGLSPAAVQFHIKSNTNNITDKLLEKIKKIDIINWQDYIKEDEDKVEFTPELEKQVKDLITKSLFYYYKRKGYISKRSLEKILNPNKEKGEKN